MEKIGVIAGSRKLPLKFCEAARRKNYYIVAVAIKGDASRQLNKLVQKIYWIGLEDFSRMFEIFKSEGVSKVVMAGQVSPHRLFRPEIHRDAQLKDLLLTIKDKKADTIFRAIAGRIEGAGFTLLDSTTFIGELMPKKGVLTKREPDFQEWEDIYFGFDLAKEIAYLDIGQTVAVKHKAVVAVEALEGTDRLIRRAGLIAKDGITVVKVSKPHQDVRFDMPVVGLNTIKNLMKVKARCLAIEGGKTLFIDQAVSVKLADKAGITLVAI